jgi:molecular chaperone HtpG
LHLRTTPKKTTTLKEYIGRMKAEQKDIYYLSGESRLTLENSPHTESLRAKGYEILYLIDAYDENRAAEHRRVRG